MASDLLQILIYFAIIVACTPLLGGYMARVFAGERTLLSPVLIPLERAIYGACGIDAGKEQHWTRYALALLATNAVGWVILYAILRLQHLLPWNPQDMPPMAPDLAFNTAVSFVTNTNWQAYGGETTLSYFSQMVGLTVQNFISAATGIAVAIAVIRGFAGRSVRTIGNFYADLVRGVLYVLLPLSIDRRARAGLAGHAAEPRPLCRRHHARGQSTGAGAGAGRRADRDQAARHQRRRVLQRQLRPSLREPDAALEPARDGLHPADPGGVLLHLRQDGARPPPGLGDLRRHGGPLRRRARPPSTPPSGWATRCWPKRRSTPRPAPWRARRSASASSTRRCGRSSTTAASNGSVNAMHDSFTPLGGLVLMLNMQLGEIVWGGVGAGLYGMLLFVVLAVFIAGLMVGRTPEYLGKKIEAKEVKLAVLALLSMPVGILIFGGLAAVLPVALASVQDPGPHGLSEILYAYSSATGNNGSAFAGFNANTPFHNTMQGLAMLLGRYAFIVPMLAIAGSLGAKKTVPTSSGTFPTDGALFVTLLVAVILIVGGLTFFPALALGPIAEQLAMQAGHVF